MATSTGQENKNQVQLQDYSDRGSTPSWAETGKTTELK